MNRSGAVTSLRSPWNRPRKRIIHFENSGAITIALQSAAIGVRQTVAGKQEQLPWRDIEKRGAGEWQLIEVFNFGIDDNFSAQSPQMCGERISKTLRTALGYGPADRMAHHPKYQAKRGGRRLFERQKRVRRQTA